MRITDLRTESFRWPRPTPISNGSYTYTHFGFNAIHVETDGAVSGLGFGKAIDEGGDPDPALVQSLVKYFARDLIGQDPFDTERLWHAMWKPKFVGRRGIATRLLGGIDMALWDLKARHCGLSLNKLLGGYTDRVPFYVMAGYYEEGKGLDDLEADVVTAIGSGAEAVKVKIGRLSIEEDIDRVRVIRKAVGDDIRIMVDANNAYRHFEAITMADRLDPFDIYWFEEPVAADDYAGQAAVARATPIAIASGENEYTKHGFRDIIEHRAADILQPDVLVLGGVTEFMKVAALAEANGLLVSTHGSDVAPMHLPLLSAIPNGSYLECTRPAADSDPSGAFASRDVMLDRRFTHPLMVEDGHMIVPDRPGLGIELDEQELGAIRVSEFSVAAQS